MDLLPDFGCMCFPRGAGLDDTRAFARRWLAEHDAVVASGEFSGAPGQVRIGHGSDAPASTRGRERLATGLSARTRQA